MEMHERIRNLRKNYLHLSQTEFGEKLGVSRSVIKNIELNTLARPEQKLSLIKLMCKEFSVNEEWILHGTEPMIIEPDSFSLDEFVKQHNGTELELKIIKAYFELEPDIREKVVKHFKSHLDNSKAEPSESAIEKTYASNNEPMEMTVEEAEAEYIKSRSKPAKKAEFCASNITADTTNSEKAANQ